MTTANYRERAGLAFSPPSATHAVDLIARAEAAGVTTAWMVMPATGLDTMTIFAAAAVRTERIRLGTAIVPAFTRHPLALATQALALEGLAPGRLRLGIGTAHARTMVAVYHLPFDRPLHQLREYLHILRTALREGAVSFHGEFYEVDVKFASTPKTPVPIAALRPPAFALAGEASDGAISWLCPVEYLLAYATPALERGAVEAGRSTPPLLAHIPVVVAGDRDTVRAIAREQLGYYAAAPFYARMFADAGYPLGPGGVVTDALIDTLVVSGDEAAIADQLRARLDRGLDEILVSQFIGPDRRADEDALIRILGGL
jgi:F420-dependent oxidoreductase-like protein